MSSAATDASEVDLDLVFSVARHRLSVPHHAVVRIVSPPPTVAVPRAHPALRGLMNLRGEVLGLVCVRRLLGLPDLGDETAALLAELAVRELDHRRWVDELVASVEQDRPFTLTTDPHACAFGRWFDSYRASTEALESVLRRLDKPHQRIHALAVGVARLRAAGRTQDLARLVANAKVLELGRLLRELDEVRHVVSTWQRQIALVLAPPARPPLALLVDTVEALATLGPAEGDGALASDAIFAGLGRTTDGEIVQRLDLEAVYRAVAG